MTEKWSKIHQHPNEKADGPKSKCRTLNMVIFFTLFFIALSKSIAHVQSLHSLHLTKAKMRWQATTLMAINNKCLYVFGGLVNFVVMCSNFTSCCDDTRGPNSVCVCVACYLVWHSLVCLLDSDNHRNYMRSDQLNVKLLTTCASLSWTNHCDHNIYCTIYT